MSISFDASVSEPAFVSRVSTMPCRAEHVAFSLNRPADVIALFIFCISCFPDVAVVFDPNFQFMFWNVIAIGLYASFSFMHFGTSMWWYSSSDAILLNALFVRILAFVPCCIGCIWGCLLRLRFGIVRRTFCFVCITCGV